MKLRQLIILIFILSFTSFNSFCQNNNGQIIFFAPLKEKLFVKVDDTVYKSAKIELPDGTHQFSLWAPNHTALDTIITIYPDSIIRAKVFLSHTQTYIDYVYNKHQVNKKAIGLSISGVLIAGTILASSNANKQKRKALEAYRVYQLSGPLDVVGSKNELDEEQRSYRKKKRATYALGIASLFSVGANYYLFKKFGKHKKMEYTPDPPPFNITYSPSSNNHDQIEFCLTLNF